MWQKIGNFQNTFAFGNAPLRQQVEYKNITPDSRIKKLWIGRYSDGGFQITLTSPNAQKFDELSSSIVEAGFPNPDFIDRDMKIYRLSTADSNVLTNFVKAIKQTQPDFSHIETEVYSSLQINLGQEQSLPTWIKSGNFQPSIIPGSRLNRQVTFTNRLPTSNIKEIQVLGYLHGEVRISLKVLQANSVQNLALENALRAANFSVGNTVGRRLTISIATNQELT